MQNDSDFEKLLKSMVPSEKAVTPEVMARLEAIRLDMNDLHSKPPSSPHPKIALESVLKNHLAPF